MQAGLVPATSGASAEDDESGRGLLPSHCVVPALHGQSYFVQVDGTLNELAKVSGLHQARPL